MTALVAAWPATWLIDQAYVSASAPLVITGNLYDDTRGRVWAWLAPPSEPPDDLRGDAIFFGAFRIDVQGVDRGWPFVTSRATRRLALNVNLFEENLSVGVSELPPDSPVRLAIESVLAEYGDGRIAAAVWSGSVIEPVNRARGWVANLLVLSVGLVVAAWLIVTILRVASLFRVAEKKQRAAQHRRGDRCTACGYDLQGNIFGERCPECGTVV